MSELQVVATQLGTSLLVLWVVVVGLAYMVRGPHGAVAVIRYPLVGAARATWWLLRQIVWLLRRAIGGLFVALGNWIRG